MVKTQQEEKRDKALLIIVPVVGIAAAIYFLSKKAGAEPDPEKAILYGQVTDSSTAYPVPGVSVNCGGHTAKTDGNGLYQIINIPPGTYEVSFTHKDYEPLYI